MRKIEQQLANTITWAASTAITPINLPNEQIITRVDMDWAITMNVASGGAAAFNGLAVPKATWNQFGIQGGPSFFVNMTHPELLLYQNLSAHGGIVMDAVNTTTNTAAVFYFRQRVHFGSVPFGLPRTESSGALPNMERGLDNPFDPTAGIVGPTFAKGGLVLTMTNPANTVSVSNSSITTATVAKIIVYGILATNAELAAMQMAQPSFTETGLALSAFGTSTGLQSRQDLPVGQYLRRITGLLMDNGTSGTTQAADDTRLSAVGVAVSGEGDRRILYSDWYPSRNRSIMSMGNAIVSQANTPTAGAVTAGLCNIDFRRYTDATDPRASQANLYGLNLIGQQAGNYQLAMTVATANGNFYLLYEQLKPAMAPPSIAPGGVIAPGANLLTAGR